VSDWINTMRQSVGGNTHAEINAPDAGMLLTDNELVYINISGMQRARLGEIAKVSRENGELVISSADRPLIRGAIKTDKETLSNFFSQVRQVAAWSRERRTVIMDSPSATPMDSSFVGRTPDAPVSRPDLPDPIADMPVAPPVRPLVTVSSSENPYTPPIFDSTIETTQSLGRAVTLPPAIPQDRPRVTSAPIPRFSESRAEPVKLEYAGFWVRFLAYIIDAILLGIAGTFLSNLFTGSATAALTRLSQQTENNTLNGEQALAELTQLLPAFTTSIVLATAATTILTWLYFAFLESGERQGTLGKMALGLIVTDDQNQRMNFARASGRYFAKSIVPFVMTILSLLSIVPALTSFMTSSTNGNTEMSGLAFFVELFGALSIILTLGTLVLIVAYVMAAFTAKKQALHDLIAKTLVLKK
jgi:uncharacterized RDD family membrane protein YckC